MVVACAQLPSKGNQEILYDLVLLPPRREQLCIDLAPGLTAKNCALGSGRLCTPVYSSFSKAYGGCDLVRCSTWNTPT